jgi:hypothetical protein
MQFLSDLVTLSSSSSSSSATSSFDMEGRGLSSDSTATVARCHFASASSLFQRWNLHMRYNYGFLRSNKNEYNSNNVMQVLLIVRNFSSINDNTAKHISSRIYSNEQEIIVALSGFISRGIVGIPQMKLVVQDLAALSYEHQVAILGNSSIIVGMHGKILKYCLHRVLIN